MSRPRSRFGLVCEREESRLSRFHAHRRAVRAGSGSRTSEMQANNPSQRFAGDVTTSTARHTGAVQPGTKLRSETPPLSGYRRNGAGCRISIRNSGNSSVNCRRSRWNRIHGSAPLAPESGPLDGNSHVSAAAGTAHGAACPRRRWRAPLFHGSTITTLPPGARQRAASAKNFRGVHK